MLHIQSWPRKKQLQTSARRLRAAAHVPAHLKTTGSPSPGTFSSLPNRGINFWLLCQVHLLWGKAAQRFDGHKDLLKPEG